MISIKDALYNQMMDVYSSKGIDIVISKCWKLMELSENNARYEKYQKVKGELAEIALECILLELSKQGKIKGPHIILKSLCISFINGSTTEMDIVLITEQKIYMFECKSYKNFPKITDKCLINGKVDVYYQNTLHTTALHQRLCSVISKSESNSKPYRYIMFEMSTHGVNDKRDEKWREMTPIVNADTVLSFLIKEFEKNSKKDKVVDVTKAVKILKKYDNESKEMFKKHVARLKKKYH